MALRRDYFTRAEFREVTGDTNSPFDFEDEDIDRGQDEAVRALEQWARSSWANVADVATATYTTGVDAVVLSNSDGYEPEVGQTVRILGAGGVGIDLATSIIAVADATHVTIADLPLATSSGALFADGDGTASDYRQAVQTEWNLWSPDVTTEHVPVNRVLALSSGFGPTLIADYDYDPDTGIVRWGTSPYDPALDLATLTYHYGHGECPWPVKRPTIQAAKALLGTSDKSSKLPAGLTQYSVEGATFSFGENDSTSDKLPWPWEPDASAALRGYWAGERPRRFVKA